jgi:hypothetical protein
VNIIAEVTSPTVATSIPCTADVTRTPPDTAGIMTTGR